MNRILLAGPERDFLERECMKDLLVTTVLERDEHSHEVGTLVVLEDAAFRSWKSRLG